MTLTVSVPAGLQSNLSGVYSAFGVKWAIVTGDTKYPAGGYPVSKTQFACPNLLIDISTNPSAVLPGVYQIVYDPYYNALRYYLTPTTPSSLMYEVASGTDLSGITLVVQVEGA